MAFDQEKLAGCFSPQLFTDEESESDLGNMPRLVQAMGMSSAFSKGAEESSQAGADQADDWDPDPVAGEDGDDEQDDE